MSFRPFEVVEALAGDERHEAVRVELEQHKPRVLKVPTDADMEGFLKRGRHLLEVVHPSLRRLRQVGRLADGRPFVLLDLPRGLSLSESPELTLRDALEVGLQLSSALGALHEAGLVTGPLRSTDIFLSKPATLDASVAGEGQPRSDIQSLVQVLLKAGLRRGADARLRARLEAAGSAAELTDVLRSMLLLFQSSIALGATTVEVVEPDLSGNQLGPWLLEKVVGEGAIGRVYLAHHRERRDAVAVKVLKREHASDAEVRHRFVLEAQAVNAVRDEHLVEVYDFGEVAHPGGPLVYCAMELLDGEPLSDTLSRGPVELDRAVRIAHQLALALHAAHLQGVIHRDIKPENVFLHRRGEEPDHVKVLDFGLAKVLRPIGGLAPPGTHSGIVVGTPEYMAPEQAIGLEVDLRVDLFAIGLVLYELITGTSPYQADTFARRIVELTHTTAPRLPDETPLGEHVPARLRDLVAKCLEKEPGDRFQTGAELALALEEVAEPDLTDAELASAISRPKLPWPVVLAVAGLVTAGTVVAIGPKVPDSWLPVSSASLVGGVAALHSISLQVESTPAGARVIRADTGEVLGLTPLSVAVGATGAVDLRLSLDGYSEERHELSGTGDASWRVGMKPLERRPKVGPKVSQRSSEARSRR